MFLETFFIKNMDIEGNQTFKSYLCTPDVEFTETLVHEVMDQVRFINSPITTADEKFVELEVFTPAIDLQFGKYAVKNQANEICLILDRVVREDKYYVPFMFDSCQTIEYDIQTRNLVLGFDKRFLQTFVNKFLLDIDKFSSSSDFTLEYFDKELQYKVYEATLADRNIVKIAFKASYYDFKALNTLAWYFYSKYNYGALHHRDKRDVKNKKLRFRAPRQRGKLKEWAVERVPDSYFDETDRVFYKDYEYANTGSDAYIADIEWYNKFRYKPQFYKRFAPENCHFNKENLVRAIVKKVAKTAEENGHKTILKDNGVAIFHKRRTDKIQYIVDYKHGRFYYYTYIKQCPQGGSIFVKEPVQLTTGQLWSDYDIDKYSRVYEILGLVYF